MCSINITDFLTHDSLRSYTWNCFIIMNMKVSELTFVKYDIVSTCVCKIWKFIVNMDGYIKLKFENLWIKPTDDR